MDHASSHMVEFDGVSKSFGETTALVDVTLRIPAGKTMAVVGPRRSGKSTLLRIINGLERPDAGVIRVFGASAPVGPGRNARRLRRSIGFALQGTGLLPHLTSYRNAALPARLAGLKPIAVEQRFRELLIELDLPADVSDRYPNELPPDILQRLALCRALMLKPPLLLLDEPFSALDPMDRVSMHSTFENLVFRERLTAVMATQDVREAVRLGDNLAFLKDGQVLRAGQRREVMLSPNDPYVEKLVNLHL